MRLFGVCVVEIQSHLHAIEICIHSVCNAPAWWLLWRFFVCFQIKQTVVVTIYLPLIAVLFLLSFLLRLFHRRFILFCMLFLVCSLRLLLYMCILCTFILLCTLVKDLSLILRINTCTVRCYYNMVWCIVRIRIYIYIYFSILYFCFFYIFFFFLFPLLSFSVAVASIFFTLLSLSSSFYYCYYSLKVFFRLRSLGPMH